MHETLFWVQKPNDINFLQFWPTKSDTPEVNCNAITVLIIYLSILLLMFFQTFLPIYAGLVGVAIVAIIYYMKYYKEDMSDMPITTNRAAEAFGNQLPQQLPLRNPTINNPMMNVPIHDYDEKQKYRDYQHYAKDQSRPEVRHLRKEIEGNFENRLFQNPSGALWERINSQRQFYSTPVGSVPNNQSAFAQNLYGHPEGVCKSGSIWARYGIEETTDSQLCNGWNVSTPTGHQSYD